MYTFDEYAPASAEQLLQLMAARPFALLVSAGRGVPVATHLPVILAPGQALEGLQEGTTAGPADHNDAAESQLVGLTLWGHMARVNPQWHDLAGGAPVLVVFSGPDAYVSAAFYERTPAVPTWNYSAVHVTAVPTLVTEPVATLEVLRATVSAAEDTGTAGWDMSTSVEHFRRIQSGVVAFSLRVVAVQGVVKLSQDKPDADWQRVHDALARDASR